MESLIPSDQSRSVTHSCLTIYDLMDCSMPGFSVHHKLLELAQTHVNQAGDAIQPPHPLLSLLLLPSLFPWIRVFQWVSLLHQVAKVMEFQLQHQSFKWIYRTDFIYDWLTWSPWNLRDYRVFSNTIVQKHQFFGAQLSFWSNSHIRTWPLEKP